MSKPTIAILGAGNMATALALSLAPKTQNIRLYCIEQDAEQEINHHHFNTKYLPGKTLPFHISASHDLYTVVDQAEIVFLAVPSHALHEVLQQSLPSLVQHPPAAIASLTKGLDPKTHEPIALTEFRFFPATLQQRLCLIGGPAVANEIADESYTGLVVAGQNSSSVRTIASLLQNTHVKVEHSSDPYGVGYASALKNAYAISLGFCDGLKLPMNSKALVFTIALCELNLLLRSLDAQPETILGLACIGDLLVTGFSPHGRNRTYGERLVQAKTKDPQALGLTTVEGIQATQTALKLAKHRKLKLPLLKSIGQCLAAERDFTKPFVKFLQSPN